jgi:hypothetical protein
MYMNCKTILLGALLIAAGCRSTEDIEAPAVKAAIRLSVEDVRTSSVSVTAESKQAEVVSCIMTPPVPSDQLNLLSMDAIGKVELLKEKGSNSEDFTRSFTGLRKLTSYKVVAAGCDASGNIITAPTDIEFKTEDIVITVTTGYERLSDGSYRYDASVKPDDSVVGYRYIFDFEHAAATPEELLAILKSDGGNVKTASGEQTFSINKENKATAIIAIIGQDISGQDGDLVAGFASAVSVVTIDFGSSVLLTQEDPEIDHFTGTVNVPAETNFTLNFDGVQWGFLPYSGNGGLGVVNNQYAAVPYYNVVQTEGVTVKFEAFKAVGRMAKISEGGVPFWLNMPAAATVSVDFNFDQANGIPRYYLEIVKDDPSVVLDEQFDLFCISGDYMSPANGCYVDLDPSMVDGTEAGTPVGLKTAQSGTTGGNKNLTAFKSSVFSWPDAEVTTVNKLATEAYIRNRGMEGWTLVNVGEKPGAVQLCVSKGYLGTITTPALDRLTGATDITVELDMARFSTASKNDIGFNVIGDGTLTSGEVTVDGKDRKTLEVSGKQYRIGFADDICPPSVNNDVKNKPVSHFKFKVAGATSSTKISIDTNGLGYDSSVSSASRCFIFGIKITK